MLSASSQCVGRSPLSPLTQTTLEKHLPGLPTKRFLQQSKVLKVDVGCITGTSRVVLILFSAFIRSLCCAFNWITCLRRIGTNTCAATTPLIQTLFRSLVFVFVFFFSLEAFVQSHDSTQSISIFLMRIQTNGIPTLNTLGTLNSLNTCAFVHVAKKKMQKPQRKSHVRFEVSNIRQSKRSDIRFRAKNLRFCAVARNAWKARCKWIFHWCIDVSPATEAFEIGSKFRFSHGNWFTSRLDGVEMKILHFQLCSHSIDSLRFAIDGIHTVGGRPHWKWIFFSIFESKQTAGAAPAPWSNLWPT